MQPMEFRSIWARALELVDFRPIWARTLEPVDFRPIYTISCEPLDLRPIWTMTLEPVELGIELELGILGLLAHCARSCVLLDEQGGEVLRAIAPW